MQSFDNRRRGSIQSVSFRAIGLFLCNVSLLVYLFSVQNKNLKKEPIDNSSDFFLIAALNERVSANTKFAEIFEENKFDIRNILNSLPPMSGLNCFHFNYFYHWKGEKKHNMEGKLAWMMLKSKCCILLHTREIMGGLQYLVSNYDQIFTLQFDAGPVVRDPIEL